MSNKSSIPLDQDSTWNHIEVGKTYGFDIEWFFGCKGGRTTKFYDRVKVVQKFIHDGKGYVALDNGLTLAYSQITRVVGPYNNE